MNIFLFVKTVSPLEKPHRDCRTPLAAIQLAVISLRCPQVGVFDSKGLSVFGRVFEI